MKGLGRRLPDNYNTVIRNFGFITIFLIFNHGARLGLNCKLLPFIPSVCTDKFVMLALKITAN